MQVQTGLDHDELTDGNKEEQILLSDEESGENKITMPETLCGFRKYFLHFSLLISDAILIFLFIVLYRPTKENVFIDIRTPPSVAFLKFHKTSGTTTSYDIFSALTTLCKSNPSCAHIYSIHKPDYDSLDEVCLANNCTDSNTICLLLQHKSLELFKSHGFSGFLQCDPNVVMTTILREPLSRVISAYYYFRCGKAQSVEGFLKDIRKKAVQNCVMLHEYSKVFKDRGLDGIYVGLLTERDFYYVMLSRLLGFDPTLFHRSLPLMNKNPPFQLPSDSFHTLTHKLANNERIRLFIEEIAPEEFEVYENAKKKFEKWKSTYNLDELVSDVDLMKMKQQEYRRNLGLDLTNPIQCPLTPSVKNVLPNMMWEKIGFNGNWTAYCA